MDRFCERKCDVARWGESGKVRCLSAVMPTKKTLSTYPFQLNFTLYHSVTRESTRRLSSVICTSAKCTCWAVSKLRHWLRLVAQSSEVHDHPPHQLLLELPSSSSLRRPLYLEQTRDRLQQHELRLLRMRLQE
jgi:hypothetical protein